MQITIDRFNGRVEQSVAWVQYREDDKFWKKWRNGTGDLYIWHGDSTSASSWLIREVITQRQKENKSESEIKKASDDALLAVMATRDPKSRPELKT